VLYLLVRWPRSVAIGWLAGVAMGIAVAARANLLLARRLPMLMAAFPDAGRTPLCDGPLVVRAVGLALVLAPILWRNHELTGTLGSLRGRRPGRSTLPSEPAFRGFPPRTPGIAFDKYRNQPVAAGAASFAEIFEHWWTAKAWDVIEHDPWP
jgi:hypothetical protein